MGGRGSKFIVTDHTSQKKFINLGDYQKDLETTKQNDLTRRLKNYNIMVCKSTDSLDEELFQSNLKQIEFLAKKYQSLLIQEPEQELHIRAHKISGDTIACFARNDERALTELQICYNKNLVSDKKEMQEKVSRMIKYEHSPKVENKTDYVATHEFGHYLQRCILEKRMQKDIATYSNFKNGKLPISILEEQADMMSYEIFELSQKKYGNQKSKLSNYSIKDSFEWFAETFASAHCNANKPPLARAMLDYLKKELNNDNY